MSEFEQFDDIPRYRKKSTAKTPKKSKHKHLCEPCVIAYPDDWHTKEHLRSNKMHNIIGAYCPICGKIGELKDRTRWYGRDTVFVGQYQLTETKLTKEGEQEMSATTRTLPYFEIDDPFTRFVQLKNA